MTSVSSLAEARVPVKIVHNSDVRLVLGIIGLQHLRSAQGALAGLRKSSRCRQSPILPERSGRDHDIWRTRTIGLSWNRPSGLENLVWPFTSKRAGPVPARAMPAAIKRCQCPRAFVGYGCAGTSSMRAHIQILPCDKFKSKFNSRSRRTVFAGIRTYFVASPSKSNGSSSTMASE